MQFHQYTNFHSNDRRNQTTEHRRIRLRPGCFQDLHQELRIEGDELLSPKLGPKSNYPIFYNRSIIKQTKIVLNKMCDYFYIDVLFSLDCRRLCGVRLRLPEAVALHQRLCGVRLRLPEVTVRNHWRPGLPVVVKECHRHCEVRLRLSMTGYMPKINRWINTKDTKYQDKHTDIGKADYYNTFRELASSKQLEHRKQELDGG